MVVGLTGYVLYSTQDMPFYQIVIVFIIFFIITFGFLYPLIKASQRIHTKKDDERESILLDDVENIKNRKFSKAKSIVGKFYFWVIIFGIVFPVVANILGLSENVRLASGLFAVFIFIGLIVFFNKKFN